MRVGLKFCGLSLLISLASSCRERENTRSAVESSNTFVASLAGIGGDDDPGRITPAWVMVPNINTGPGMGVTWDARVFVTAMPGHFNPILARKFTIRILRPENLTLDALHRPVFGPGSFSDDDIIRMPGVADTADYITLIGTFGHPTLAPNRFYQENPYASNDAGEPIGGPKEKAKYATYDMWLYTQKHPFEATPSNPVSNDFGRSRIRAIIIDPYTPNARIFKSYYVEQWQALTSAYVEQVVTQPPTPPFKNPKKLPICTKPKQKNCVVRPVAPAPITTNVPRSDALRGIEPSITEDGRVLVWQGAPQNTGEISHIMYSWNQTPNATANWSRPKTFNQIINDRDANVAGIPFKQRYPIAAAPLKDMYGNAYTFNAFRGAYPWISPDGTELFFTTYNDVFWNSRRAGYSVIGRLTNYELRNIDGPVNANRYGVFIGPVASSPITYTGAGFFGSRWTPFEESRNVVVPYTKKRVTYPLFGANTISYVEVDFEEMTDRSYIAFYRMNEMINRTAEETAPGYQIGYAPDVLHTPDTSGNRNHGTLVGASFPQEYTFDGKDDYLGNRNGRDPNGQPFGLEAIPNVCNALSGNRCIKGRDKSIGVSGQAIYFPENSWVRVENSPSFTRIKRNLTVSAFVKRLQDVPSPRGMVQKPGTFVLGIAHTGQMYGVVYIGGKVQNSGPVGPVLPLNKWVHIAMTYEGGVGGALRTYVDGAEVNAAQVTIGDIDNYAQPMFIGPANPSAPAAAATVVIDEVAVSDLTRSQTEIAAAALRYVAPPTASPLADRLVLPLGLRKQDMVFPSDTPFTRKVINLGQILFVDKQLSRNENKACVTCHTVPLAFTDGQKRSPGLNGQPLQRNSPTLINRGFSRAQMLDGRAESLEAQVNLPITAPNEMNFSLPELAARLGPRKALTFPQTYNELFNDAFGVTTGPTPDLIAKALASFQRTILSGNSRVDQFEAGNVNALNAQEKHGRQLFQGKARCTSCHAGPNYTDELFHNVDLQPLDRANDLGRSNITFHWFDVGAFKTPTLRNVGVTGPYLHNGSVATLEEIIGRYNIGGVSGEFRDTEIFPIGLTGEDINDIAAFLRALTGPVTFGQDNLAPGN